MTEFKDQIENMVKLSAPARKIVSLVPSQTELLSDLGLDNETLGITKFCVHPKAWRSTKSIVGGTKDVNIAAIDALQPDLIIANKEENVESDIIMLRKKYPVWLSDISNLSDAFSMIASVGELTGRSENAIEITHQIRKSFDLLSTFETRRTLYLIWRRPWMTVGVDTFIHEMMNFAGFKNVIDGFRYPRLTDEDIRNLNPEIILLSSEPFPFKLQHIAEINQILPGAKVELVDGEMFSWYGSRMKIAPKYFNDVRDRI